MATDYDCWKESEGVVSAADVLAVFKKNVSKIRDLLVKAVELIGQENWDQDIDDLKVDYKYTNFLAFLLSFIYFYDEMIIFGSTKTSK